MINLPKYKHWAFAAALVAPNAVFAETTLKSHDGSFEIEGELLGFDGVNYNIETDLGKLLVKKEFVVCEGDCPDETAVAPVSNSGEVTLISLDGSVRVDGTLVEVTDTDFVIDSSTGRLSVRKQFVRCEGAACPQTLINREQIAISVPDAAAANLMTVIVGDYVGSKDFNLTEQVGSDGGLSTLLVGNARGQEIAELNVAQMSNLTAAKALLSGASEFAITRERITPDVMAEILGSDVEDIAPFLDERIIGLDAITFTVNSGNTIDLVGMDFVRDVLSGVISNWSQLGGADEPINVHMLASNKGLEDQLTVRGFDLAAMGQATLHSTVDDLNAAMEKDASAFGILYRSQVEGVKVLNLTTSCNVYVDSSDFAIQTEEYPLSVRWFQYTPKDGVGSEFANNISEYIATDYGQQSLANNGLVTQQLRVMPMQDQGARLLTSVLATSQDWTSNNVMREYISQVSNARRISTSLRFLSGRADLDSKAVGDLGRISEVIRSKDYEGYEVLVFGFSDSYGTLSANLSLSKRRANSVVDILLKENSGYLDLENVASYGIGPIAPVGCNTSDEGRQQNRRVEVWLRPKV